MDSHTVWHRSENTLPVKQIISFNTACCVKFSADNILNIFSYFFFQKITFGISWKLPKVTICMKSHSLFSGKYTKNIMSAEFAKVKVKVIIY